MEKNLKNILLYSLSLTWLPVSLMVLMYFTFNNIQNQESLYLLKIISISTAIIITLPYFILSFNNKNYKIEERIIQSNFIYMIFTGAMTVKLFDYIFINSSLMTLFIIYCVQYSMFTLIVIKNTFISINKYKKNPLLYLIYLNIVIIPIAIFLGSKGITIASYIFNLIFLFLYLAIPDKEDINYPLDFMLGNIFLSWLYTISVISNIYISIFMCIVILVIGGLVWYPTNEKDYTFNKVSVLALIVSVIFLSMYMLN